MIDCDVEFMESRRHEVYGTVVVFKDVAGNLWGLLGRPAADPGRTDA